MGSDFRGRYARGDVVAWDELVTLEPSPENVAEAHAIADAMMGIVRHDLEVLVARLTGRGYLFGRLARRAGSWAGYDHPPLLADTPRPVVQEGLEAIGVNAASLLAFYRRVGGVNLLGHHPGWPAPEDLDALYVEPASRSLVDALQGGLYDEDSGRLDLAPDALHKADISGGTPYGVQCPTGPFDTPWIQDDGSLPFVSYLRRSILEYGGMPGLATRPSSRVPLAELTTGLVPF